MTDSTEKKDEAIDAALEALKKVAGGDDPFAQIQAASVLLRFAGWEI